MGDEGKRRISAGQLGATLVAGILAGSIITTPVGAHITTFNHLKAKHFYTKKAADQRFVNVGEAATTSTNADSAANADKLDNLDSTAFQRSGCVNGTVLGYARILDIFYGPSYSNVPDSFTCVPGFTVRAKKTGQGEYTIDFGFDGTAERPCGEHMPLATIENASGEIMALSDAENVGVGQNCVVLIKTFNDNGTFVDLNFLAVIHRVP